MESIYNNLKDSIMSAENIFDIYIHIYSILKQHLSDVKKSLDMDYEEETDWKKELINLHDEKIFDIEVSEEYKYKILEIIPNKNKYKFLSFLKLLFEEIDEIAGDEYYLTSKSYIQEDDGRNIKLDFLNTKTSLEIGQVFYQQKNFFDEIINQKDKFSLEKDIGETVEIYQTNLLVKEKMVSDTKINLFRVTDRYINRKLKNKNNNFKIALIPFSCDKNIIDVDTIKRKDVDHITIKGINQEDKYIELVENILEELIILEVDIVIFPEMVFTQSMVNKVKEVLINNRGKFLLIICGSIWENRSNTCITLGGNGLEIGRQNKLNRYREKNEFNGIKFEDLDLSSDEKIINVYDLKSFGRFCTPICVDFINEDYFINIASVGVNICLIPTYTQSLHAFKDKSSSLGTKNFGGVFLSNYCGIAKGKEISFAYIPRKGNSFHSITCEKDDNNRCKCNFSYQRFIISINE